MKYSFTIFNKPDDLCDSIGLFLAKNHVSFLLATLVCANLEEGEI